MLVTVVVVVDDRVYLGDLARMLACHNVDAAVDAEHGESAHAAYAGEQQDVVEREDALEHAWHRLGVDAVESAVG